LVEVASSLVPQRPHFAFPSASLVSSTRLFAPQLVQVITCMASPQLVCALHLTRQ